MTDAHAAIAQCSALLTALTAIIRALPPAVAGDAAEHLRQLGEQSAAVSYGASKLPDEALHEQADTVGQLLAELESRAAAP